MRSCFESKVKHESQLKRFSIMVPGVVKVVHAGLPSSGCPRAAVAARSAIDQKIMVSQKCDIFSVFFWRNRKLGFVKAWNRESLLPQHIPRIAHPTHT